MTVGAVGREGLHKKIQPKMRALVWEADEGICGICGEPADPLDWTADHILPHSLGGRTVVDNLRVTHPRCNRTRTPPMKMTEAEIADAIQEWTVLAQSQPDGRSK